MNPDPVTVLIVAAIVFLVLAGLGVWALGKAAAMGDQGDAERRAEARREHLERMYHDESRDPFWADRREGDDDAYRASR